MRAIAHFLIALLEALLKCAPLFALQFLSMYPLAAVGQGREAMRALLDPAPANLSWFLFPASLLYAAVLTAAFLFFLLSRWNYPADDRARAFCRIWVPLILTLVAGMLWPLAAELSAEGSRFWEAMTGMMYVLGSLALAGGTWSQTRPVVSRRMALFLAGTMLVLFGLLLFGTLLVFFSVSVVVLTIFCGLVSADFRDSNPSFHPWRTMHAVTLTFAGLLAGGILLLAGTSIPWRMFFGTPAIVMWGFSFLVALAFLLTALLSRISPVVVRAGWLLLVLLLVFMPLNQEPLRVLSGEVEPAPRMALATHFTAWLRARSEVGQGDAPYPVFFVAAEGGGARAAYWTSTLLAGLEERYPGFTEHVYAISGVSGGSVGAAIFAGMHHDLPARGGGCAPLVPNGLQGIRACTAYVYQWDLLGPALSGLLLHDLPFGWRGVRRATDLEQALEYAWAGSTGGRGMEEPFQRLWAERPYHVPSLILNTTSADTGERMVVSNLGARGDLTERADVESLLGRPVRLSTAAFLSARFPVISPVATFTAAGGEQYRLVDGGYFNNSGMASIGQLLRAVLPVTSSGEFAGKIRPIVLVVSSSPETPKKPAGWLAGSVAGALLEPVSVLKETGSAHEGIYLRAVQELTGEAGILQDLRPAQGSAEVALGWLLSAETRCGMDVMVNVVLNGSKGSTAIGEALGQRGNPPAAWTSCPAAKQP